MLGDKSLQVDSADNIVLSAGFRNTVNLGGSDLTAPGGDLFLAKLTPSFGHLWSKHFAKGIGDFVFPSGLAIDSKNDILLAGTSGRALDFGLGPLTPTSTELGGFFVKFQP